ncbi:MAG: helix-turn-helix domain-containing protein [Bacilli bacterium]|jgi:transcriptional regulator with XRE-family HTH domain|nr:helix-turn-helix domain-containing protein [Bacilli bacterium]
MDLGTKIQTLRKNKNLTQSQLADALFVSRQAVQKWECSITSPDISKLPELAKLFNISIETLLDPKIEEDELILESRQDKKKKAEEEIKEKTEEKRLVPRRSILDYVLMPWFFLMCFLAFISFYVIGAGLVILSFAGSIGGFAGFIWSILQISANIANGTGAIFLSLASLLLSIGMIYPLFRFGLFWAPRFYLLSRNLIYKIKTFDFWGFVS